MKKFLKLIFVFMIVCVMAFSLLLFVTACKKPKSKTVNVYVPAGATVLSIAQMVNNNSKLEGYDIKYNVVSGSEALIASVTRGEADIFIAPTNSGAILYNTLNKKIQLIANEFNSLLYVVGKQDVSQIEKLKGKVVYVFGEGKTPDLTFQYVLNKKNILVNTDKSKIVEDKVNMVYVSDGKEAMAKLKQANSTENFAVLGEPLASVAAKQGFNIRFSMNTLWNEATMTTEGFPQASLFAVGDILNDNTFIEWFINESKSNCKWVKENPEDAVKTLSDAGYFKFPIPLNDNLLNNINFDFKDATVSKNQINQYLTVLYNMNPITVGNKLPQDDFYYGIK